MAQLATFVIHHWPLWVALVVLLIVIFANEWLAQSKRAVEVSPAAAVDLMNHEGMLVFDVRPLEAFRSGHIIHSQHMTEEAFHQDKMTSLKSKKALLVCDRGLQSQALATRLRTKGFEHLVVLRGGMTAWSSAQLPLVKGKK